MRDFEGNAGSPLSTKDRIRERYKGINPDELEVIPALPKENIFESTKTRRVAVYARVCVSTILVRNQKGLKNLYRIISELKNDGICVNVPISVLEKYHEGLLYGSACHEGSVFLAHYQGNPDELEDLLNFYDYFEIVNFNGTAKEKKINNIIVNLANELKKPVVAVSCARYIGKNNATCLKILSRESRTNRWYENSDNLHLRTDEEMLSEFSYLGDDSEDVVIKNTQKIADNIENVTIISDVNKDNIFRGSHAYEVIKISAENFVINKYGESLPQIIAERLRAELQLPVVKKFADRIWLSRIIVKEISIRGRLCITRLAAASSFLIYCLGITEINPLPPHYYCPKCKQVKWVDNVYCGLDLPEKECSCGGTMHGDGMNIPFAHKITGKVLFGSFPTLIKAFVPCQRILIN